MNFLRSMAAAAAFFAGTAAGAETVALTGATVHTAGPRGSIENATILVQDGIVREVGPNVTVPAGVRVIDAAGKIVTPGLFTPFGQIGLVEVGAVDGTVDYVQRGDRYAASFDVTDAYNPRSSLVASNRIEGITQALIAPSGSYPDALGNQSRVLSGLGSVVSLADENWLIHRGAAMVAHFGETGSGYAGGSRAAALMILRSALADARDYAANRQAFLERNRRDYSVSQDDLEALQGVLDRSIPLIVRAHRAADIARVAAFAQAQDIRVVILGGAEAWLVAERLAEADVPVILDSMANLPQDFDRLNARLDAPALLDQAGVVFAIGGDSANQTHNARNITQAAGIAVANGLSWQRALESITIAPARILGVEGQSGSIEPGKRADLVLWEDDPLELTSYPSQVLIAGTAIAMESRQTLLRDRYLRQPGTPPAWR